ncbi:ABC transporter ATP-binding protein [Jeotgalibaca caeni]|uniref:ABC transporter ATP-binding protein n=1 Tax=Jeotgalibaca caeni TaxID=3028623 RepID=UPI00237D9B65|nr:ABC transporter ATP-binding protein [Jeotgalibaca caeni]MDE1548435.1 ABC transporter ATP-binding protein [Jeotgalibaca caeni]
MEFVTIQNITKRFDKKTVVDDVTFSIKKGEKFGLIGPNGAGKSTLINMLTGLVEADAGTITVDGKTIKKNPIDVKAKIGLVPQELALMETMNAYDNLEFFGSLYGLKGKELKQAIEQALAVTGLSDRRKEKVKKFSGGMKRRLNISAAIMHRPELLILDEPTVGVDPQSRNYIFDFINELNEQYETTILYISHYMEEVESLCDRIFIMDIGKEIAFGTKEEIKSMIRTNDKVELELDSMSEKLLAEIQQVSGVLSVQNELGNVQLLVDAKRFQLRELIAAIEQQNGDLKGIRIEEPSLEEVFLSITGKTLRD